MSAAATDTPYLLQGRSLWTAGIMLAIANFIVVLDMTIANVSVPHIAGGLAVSSTEGTYVITSYAVAEAISVPLTGWLAARFGTVRTFALCVLLFGLFSALCGLAPTLGVLIAGRVMQGLAGGPLMPLSQTLLLRIFPPNKRAAALTLWSMTTITAPIMGPIIGGWINDNWSWPYIFFINIPITVICGIGAWRYLRPAETKIEKAKIDFVGLGLLVVWVAALQIMLDEGKNLDWFASTEIWALAIIAVIGFFSFLIWEFTQENPVVDLRVFRHRGFTASVITIGLAFGAYFGSVVLTPLWLQTYMGYTATWSGMTMAATGVLAVVAAPVVAKLSQTVDPRRLVFIGVSWMGIITFYRSFGTTDMTYSQIALPLLFQGIGMPLFFIPLTGLALSSVEQKETASAAGLMSFLRTLCGAIATSLVTTSWESDTTVFRSDMVGRLESPGDFAAQLGDSSGSSALDLGLFDQLVQSQAVMLATNHIFLITSIAFAIAASCVWIAPKPSRKADTSAAH